jgi:hypothetical protein
MRKRHSALALILCLGSSLAFAGKSSKSPPPCEASNTSPAKDANSTASPCPPAKKKEKNTNAKPASAPTKEEQEFDHLLLGIHG